MEVSKGLDEVALLLVKLRVIVVQQRGNREARVTGRQRDGARCSSRYWNQPTNQPINQPISHEYIVEDDDDHDDNRWIHGSVSDGGT